jgi:hypothetical protein
MSAPRSQTLPPVSVAGADAAPAGTARLSALRPRLLPKARRPIGSTPGHASWDADPAGVTRLRLSQSRESTSRTGRSTGVNDARSRPGAGLQAPPAGTALAPSTAVAGDVPSMSELGAYVTETGINVKGSSPSRRRILPASLHAALGDEAVAPREFLYGREQPHQELIVRLDRRACALGIVGHRSHAFKKNRPGLRPGPRGKEIKTQGVKSVRATRKPRPTLRRSVVDP